MGELRPQFINACDPDLSLLNCTSSDGLPLYVTNYECRGDSGIVRHSRYGHESVCGMRMSTGMEIPIWV